MLLYPDFNKPDLYGSCLDIGGVLSQLGNPLTTIYSCLLMHGLKRVLEIIFTAVRTYFHRLSAPYIQPIASRTIRDVRIPIIQLINFFPNTKTIHCDNEVLLSSMTKTFLLKDLFGIYITLLEIPRCLKLEKKIDEKPTSYLVTIEYKRIIHSVFILAELRKQTNKLAIAQQAHLERKQNKMFDIGERVLVKKTEY